MFITLNMMGKYILIKAIKKITSEPNKYFSVRGLAREIKISVGSSKKSLDYMKENGIVTLKIIGRTYQYKANLKNPLCKQWKILFNVDQINDAKIVEHFTKRIENIYSILLYGSSAKGTNDNKSDIDLLVVVDKKEKINLEFINKLEKEVNVSIFTMKEWKDKAKKNKVFYENIIYDSIVLYGEKPIVL